MIKLHISVGSFSVYRKEFETSIFGSVCTWKIRQSLMYVIVMFWAIRLAKSRKLLLALWRCFDALFLASSYTYDSVVFSFITLGCVCGQEKHFSSQRSIIIQLL